MNRNGFRDLTMVLVLGLASVTSGCLSSDSLVGVDEGRVRFVLSTGAGTAAAGVDAPAPTPDLHGDEHEQDGRRRLQSANVMFSSILARNLDGVLVNVDMELPVSVDILSMEGGKEVVLPDAGLPPATYDQVVVVMTEVEVVTLDGTTITVAPPGGGWTAIVPICPFIVDGGATTTVGLTFMLQNAFKFRDNRFHFQPRLVCRQAEDGSDP